MKMQWRSLDHLILVFNDFLKQLNGYKVDTSVQYVKILKGNNPFLQCYFLRTFCNLFSDWLQGSGLTTSDWSRNIQMGMLNQRLRSISGPSEDWRGRLTKNLSHNILYCRQDISTKKVVLKSGVHPVTI